MSCGWSVLMDSNLTATYRLVLVLMAWYICPKAPSSIFRMILKFLPTFSGIKDIFQNLLSVLLHSITACFIPHIPASIPTTAIIHKYFPFIFMIHPAKSPLKCVNNGPYYDHDPFKKILNLVELLKFMPIYVTSSTKINSNIIVVNKSLTDSPCGVIKGTYYGWEGGYINLALPVVFNRIILFISKKHNEIEKP